METKYIVMTYSNEDDGASKAYEPAVFDDAKRTFLTIYNNFLVESKKEYPNGIDEEQTTIDEDRYAKVVFKDGYVRTFEILPASERKMK